MKSSMKWLAVLAGTALIALPASQAYAQQSYGSAHPTYGTQQKQRSSSTHSLEAQAQRTIKLFKEKNPKLDSYFQKSAGYAVFPTIGQGALVIGGAHGNGVVYQHGKPVGIATLSKGSVGPQVGGQSYSELIFFETPNALHTFKQGNYRISAGASAVAASAAAGGQANFSKGVAVFTTSNTGLMARAAVGGQKFSYQPLAQANRAMGAGGYGTQGGTSAGSSSNGPGQNGGTSR